jgi:hypothetical protein
MSLTCQQCQADGLLDEIARLFDDKVAAGTLLAKSDFDLVDLRPFGVPTVREWWAQVCKRIENTVDGPNQLDRLFRAAADSYPGNDKLRPFLASESKPENRAKTEGSITLNLPATYGPDEVIRILEAAKAAAREMGADIIINIGSSGSSQLNFSVNVPEDLSKEEQERIIAKLGPAIVENLAQVGYPGAEASYSPSPLRDYFIEIDIEEPDGRLVRCPEPILSSIEKVVARRPLLKARLSSDAAIFLPNIVDVHLWMGGKRYDISQEDFSKSLYLLGVSQGDTIAIWWRDRAPSDMTPAEQLGLAKWLARLGSDAGVNPQAIAEALGIEACAMPTAIAPEEAWRWLVKGVHAGRSASAGSGRTAVSRLLSCMRDELPGRSDLERVTMRLKNADGTETLQLEAGAG